MCIAIAYTLLKDTTISQKHRRITSGGHT